VSLTDEGEHYISCYYLTTKYAEKLINTQLADNYKAIPVAGREGP
jgi:hypothetical protein